MHEFKLLLLKRTLFLYFCLSGWSDYDFVLIRVWLCRGGAKGEKAWERSGGLGEVPEGP